MTNHPEAVIMSKQTALMAAGSIRSRFDRGMQASVVGAWVAALAVAAGLSQPAFATPLPTLELFLYGPVSGPAVTPDDLAPVGRGPVTMYSYGGAGTAINPLPTFDKHSALLYDIYTSDYNRTGIFANQINNLSATWGFDYSRADAVGVGGGSPRFKLQFGTFDPVTNLLGSGLERTLVMYFGSGSPVGIQSTGNAWDINNTSITWQLTGSGTPSGSGFTTDPGVKAAILADLGAREMITAVIHLDGATGSSTQTMNVYDWYLNTTGIIVNTVPEPSTLSLGALGLLGWAAARRRKTA